MAMVRVVATRGIEVTSIKGKEKKLRDPIEAVHNRLIEEVVEEVGRRVVGASTTTTVIGHDSARNENVEIDYVRILMATTLIFAS